MDFKILCVLTIFNIIMLLLNVWLRLDSERTLAEIKTSLRGNKNENAESNQIHL